MTAAQERPTPNPERLRALAQHIRRIGDAPVERQRPDKPVTGYAQDRYAHVGGCPSCIAGQAAALRRFPDSEAPETEVIGQHDRYSGQDLEAEAMTWLGLDKSTANKTFAAGPLWAFDVFNVTAEEAATELERLAETAERNPA